MEQTEQSAREAGRRHLSHLGLWVLPVLLGDALSYLPGHFFLCGWGCTSSVAILNFAQCLRSLESGLTDGSYCTWGINKAALKKRKKEEKSLIRLVSSA